MIAELIHLFQPLLWQQVCTLMCYSSLDVLLFLQILDNLLHARSEVELVRPDVDFGSWRCLVGSGDPGEV